MDRTRRAGVVAIAMAVAGCATGPSPQPVGPAASSPAVTPGAATDRTVEETSDREVPQRLTGGCGLAPDGLRPKYVLPFPEGDRFELSQGNCGRASHSGRFRFSYDFAMPMRTPVIAARDGVVYTVRADRPDGTGRVGDENFIIIEHEDGEFSRYIHLSRAGAFVRKGQRVSRGDTIGLSGASGRSAFPHLHFDVSEACREGPCQTVPSAFLNADPAIPAQRRAYAAGGAG